MRPGAACAKYILFAFNLVFVVSKPSNCVYSRLLWLAMKWINLVFILLIHESEFESVDFRHSSGRLWGEISGRRGCQTLARSNQGIPLEQCHRTDTHRGSNFRDCFPRVLWSYQREQLHAQQREYIDRESLVILNPFDETKCIYLSFTYSRCV